MQKQPGRRSLCIGATLTFVMVLLTIGIGCSGFKSNKGGSGSSSSSDKANNTLPFYHDFGDIPVPPELSVIDESTYIIEKSAGYPEGILALKGQVTRNSLLTYFKNGMTSDNWQLVTLFKSPRINSIMLFQKQNRRCIINIQEKDFVTYVQIAVAPTVAESEGGLLK